MKKLIAIMLALVLVLSFAACAKKDPAPAPTETQGTPTDPSTPAPQPEVTVMTWSDYNAAELETDVVVECYVQGHQSWWDNKITVYAEDVDGGYFMYEMACEEADAEKLVPGTKIRVAGVKTEWEGEVEIVDATFEILEDSTYTAEPQDVTELLGTDDLILKQNMAVSFKEMTVKEISFKNDGGDDIYVTLTKDGVDYDFCVEVYLTGTETQVYQDVSQLVAGDVINVESFLYWYRGPNPHITAIEKV